MTDLHWLDATAQAEMIRTGAMSAGELLAHTLARIDAINPALNAIIHRLDEAARRTPAQPGPFHGVPFLLKDIVSHSAGDPFHCGMQVLKEIGHTEPDDTWLTQRFRDAGFVLVGKTNTPELATSITCEPIAYGATRNP